MNTQPSHDRPFLRLVPPIPPGEGRRRESALALAPLVDHAPAESDAPHDCSLTVTHRDSGSVWIMTLAGEADLTTCDELGRGLALALSGNAGVLFVDVAGLEFCDSLCATALIEANCNTPDTQMVLVGGHGMVGRVFDLLDPAQTLARHE